MLLDWFVATPYLGFLGLLMKNSSYNVFYAMKCAFICPKIVKIMKHLILFKINKII
jgi:hypothetical protein